jgi:hypothetical protein
MPFQTSSEMTEGELSGVLHDLIFKDLTFKRVVQNVNLLPVGGP